tara:strand:+ start:476 stop:985 length:510 start_codon:yes stop_codon:yes gene_type:complete
MSKKTKRPAKAGKHVTQAQVGNKVTALKAKIAKVKEEAAGWGPNPYGKDFHVNQSKTVEIQSTGKYWTSRVQWETDPKAVRLSEGWLFVTGARIGSPRLQRLPHLWTQCRRANPKGLPYIAPEQPKTFKVVEREKVDPKVTAKPNGIKVYSYGSPDITFGDHLTVVLNG